jgi:hypothetical protein
MSPPAESNRTERSENIGSDLSLARRFETGETVTASSSPAAQILLKHRISIKKTTRARSAS